MTLKHLRIVAALIFFGFAPIVLMVFFGIAWSESNALAIVPIVVDPQVEIHGETVERLARSDDFTQYKTRAERVMGTQNRTLRGVSEITAVANANLRQAILGLLASVAVLYVVALIAAWPLLRKAPD